jgi:hypothetical protein
MFSWGRIMEKSGSWTADAEDAVVWLGLTFEEGLALLEAFDDVEATRRAKSLCRLRDALEIAFDGDREMARNWVRSTDQGFHGTALQTMMSSLAGIERVADHVGGFVGLSR